MTEDRYGNTRIAKIRAAYNDLRSAIAAGDLEAAQAAFDRYEQWSDYAVDPRRGWLSEAPEPDGDCLVYDGEKIYLAYRVSGDLWHQPEELIESPRWFKRSPEPPQ